MPAFASLAKRLIQEKTLSTTKASSKGPSHYYQSKASKPHDGSYLELVGRDGTHVGATENRIRAGSESGSISQEPLGKSSHVGIVRSVDVDVEVSSSKHILRSFVTAI